MRLPGRIFGGKYKLRVVDFPGKIGRNLCFLTRRSLYLLVWDSREPRAEESLREWLNCLVSHATSHSVIMIVSPYKWNKPDDNPGDELYEYLRKFQPSSRLNFGLWNTKQQVSREWIKNTGHWFTYLDVHNKKGIVL